MSYWQGIGKAPGYSRAVEAANQAVRDAEKALQATLVAEYPKGAPVIVIHHRGHFDAVVVGWDYNGARVAVRNTSTGKTSKWWAACVQLASNPQQEQQ